MIRMAILKGVESFGHIIGTLLGGELYKEFRNYYLNFSLSFGMSVFSIIYIIYVIAETVENGQESDHNNNRLFSLSNVKQSLETCFKDRPERTFVVLLILNLSICVFATETAHFHFLMTRKRYALLISNIINFSKQMI